MLPFHFWILLPYVCNACPWPLEATTHDFYLERFEYNITNATTSKIIGTGVMKCAWGCGIDPTPAVWFRLEQQDRIDTFASVLGLMGLIFTIWFSFNLWLQHKERSTNLFREDLSYQIPFILNMGYLILIGATLFHPGSVLIDSNSPSYCNPDEKTLAVGDPANGNVMCTILSLIVFITIKVEISYTTLLSIVLFHILWFPGWRIRNIKLIAHGIIWAIIIILTGCVIYLNSMSAVVSLRMCLPTLESPTATLWLELIPFVLYQFVGTVLSFVCLYKLWRMWVVPAITGSRSRLDVSRYSSTKSRPNSSKSEPPGSANRPSGGNSRSIFAFPRTTKISKISFAVKNSPRAKQYHELSVRLFVFSFVQSTFVGLLCFNFVYWYNEHDKWESVTRNIIGCQITRYGKPRMLGQLSSNGTELDAAYSCIDEHGQDGPPAWALWIFFVCLLGGTMAGFILTCSKSTIRKYKAGWDFTMEKIGIKSRVDIVNPNPIPNFATATSNEMVLMPRTSFDKQIAGEVDNITRDSAVTTSAGMDDNKLYFISTENIPEDPVVDNLITSSGSQSNAEIPEDI